MKEISAHIAWDMVYEEFKAESVLGLDKIQDRGILKLNGASIDMALDP